MSKKFTVGQKIWFMDTMPLKLKQHTVVKVLENEDENEAINEIFDRKIIGNKFEGVEA